HRPWPRAEARLERNFIAEGRLAGFRIHRNGAAFRHTADVGLRRLLRRANRLSLRSGRGRGHHRSAVAAAAATSVAGIAAAVLLVEQLLQETFLLAARITASRSAAGLGAAGLGLAAGLGAGIAAAVVL